MSSPGKQENAAEDSRAYKRWTALLLGCAIFFLPFTTSALQPVPGSYWKNARVYDVTRLKTQLPSLVGKVVGVRFLFRGKKMTGLRTKWTEGSLWQRNENGKGYSFVRVLVHDDDLEAFKGLTADANSAQLQVVYGVVAQNPEAHFLYVRLFRTSGGGSKHKPAD